MSLQKVLKYCPKLNTITGSVTASILMCQLEYWFQKTKDQPFYKFLEPCEDVCYKTGDSWTEELGFSRFEFRTAFSKIGMVYPSKTAYLKSKDPFQGKLYLSYRDRIKKRTYYVRNTQAVNAVLLSLDLPLRYSKDYKQTLNTHSPSIDSTPNIPYERILDLFHKTCTSLPSVPTLTTELKTKITKLWTQLENLGKDALLTLEKAFLQVQHSDFLCGRTPKSTWHAVLDWILQPKKFFDILKGKYAPFSPKSASYASPTSTTSGPSRSTFVVSPPTVSSSVSSSVSTSSMSTSAPTYASSHKSKPLPAFLRMENHNFDLEQLETLEQAYHWGRFHDKLHNPSPI